MKTLQESLFDKDLYKKMPDALEMLTFYLGRYLVSDKKGNSYSKWIRTIENIEKSIGYNRSTACRLNRNDVPFIKKNGIYIGIERKVTKDGNNRIILIGYGLSNNLYAKSSIPPIILISYSYSIDNAYLDIYETPTRDYYLLIESFKYNWFSCNQSDIDNFVKDVFEKIDKVW